MIAEIRMVVPKPTIRLFLIDMFLKFMLYSSHFLPAAAGGAKALRASFFIIHQFSAGSKKKSRNLFVFHDLPVK